MKNVLNSLAKIVLKPSGLIAARLAIDGTIQMNFFGAFMTKLIISNKEMKIL